MNIGYLMQAGVPDVRSYPLSGAANHVKHIITELQYRGHHVRLIARMDGQIWKSDDLQTFVPIALKRYNQGLFRVFEKGVRRIQAELKLPYAALFESIRFAEACRQALTGYDLLYERMGWVGYGGGMTACSLNVPHILEVNGDHLTELETLGIAPRGMQRWLSITVMNRMIRQASHVVSTGDGWRNRFIEQWDIDPDKVTTIENGSEVVDLLGRAELRSFRDNTDTERPVRLVFIGGFDPWQGLPVLFKAIANVHGQNIPVCLLIIGSGGQKDSLQQLAKELNLENHITFTGRLSPKQFAPLLANADVAISPYCGRAEFSGLKLLDYKAAGLPTIASGQNGQPAILEHGCTGWLVPPCDEHALSQAIIHLSSQPKLRKEMGQAARLEAEQLHSWKYTATALEQLFLQVSR